jgi:hypothetical protein
MARVASAQNGNITRLLRLAPAVADAMEDQQPALLSDLMDFVHTLRRVFLACIRTSSGLPLTISEESSCLLLYQAL